MKLYSTAWVPIAGQLQSNTENTNMAYYSVAFLPLPLEKAVMYTYSHSHALFQTSEFTTDPLPLLSIVVFIQGPGSSGTSAM